MNRTALASIAAFLLAMLWLAPSFAQTGSILGKEDPEDKKAPLEVTSDRMISDNKINKISFFGSVVAVKGKLKVEADEMHVWTDEKQDEFREMEAIGHVVITREGKVATGEKANYYADQKKIVLVGDPVLRDGRNVAQGEKVVYYFDREDMEIFGGPEKPSTLILYPKEGKEDKKEEEARGTGAADTVQPETTEKSFAEPSSETQQ